MARSPASRQRPDRQLKLLLALERSWNCRGQTTIMELPRARRAAVGRHGRTATRQSPRGLLAADALEIGGILLPVFQTECWIAVEARRRRLSILSQSSTHSRPLPRMLRTFEWLVARSRGHPRDRRPFSASAHVLIPRSRGDAPFPHRRPFGVQQNAFLRFSLLCLI